MRILVRPTRRGALSRRQRGAAHERSLISLGLGAVAVDDLALCGALSAAGNEDTGA